MWLYSMVRTPVMGMTTFVGVSKIFPCSTSVLIWLIPDFRAGKKYV